MHHANAGNSPQKPTFTQIGPPPQPLEVLPGYRPEGGQHILAPPPHHHHHQKNRGGGLFMGLYKTASQNSPGVNVTSCSSPSSSVAPPVSHTERFLRTCRLAPSVKLAPTGLSTCWSRRGRVKVTVSPGRHRRGSEYCWSARTRQGTSST